VSAAPAQAQPLRTDCRIVAVNPHVDTHGKIIAAGSRAGCSTDAPLRVRLWRAVAGPDHVVKSGAKVVGNGRVTLTVPCVSGVFYTTDTDYRGHTSRSKAVRLTCGPSSTPVATPTATPTAAPVPTGSTAPTAAPTGSATPTSGASPSTVGTALENEVVRLTNVERAKAGCGALKHDAQLHTAAYNHSADMSAKNYFDHNSQNGQSFADRIKAAGYVFTAAAENIAKGYPTAQAVVQGWMNSPGHRQNILNCAYTEIGVGYVAAGGPYWTQDFGKH
jgi:uncharacterized protein YkwD